MADSKLEYTSKDHIFLVGRVTDRMSNISTSWAIACFTYSSTALTLINVFDSGLRECLFWIFIGVNAIISLTFLMLSNWYFMMENQARVLYKHVSEGKNDLDKYQIFIGKAFTNLETFLGDHENENFKKWKNYRPWQIWKPFLKGFKSYSISVPLTLNTIFWIATVLIYYLR